jgi:hypothetical protein
MTGEASGSTRDVAVTPEAAVGHGEAQAPGGRIKSGERLSSSRRAWERWFGADLHRYSGTSRWLTREVDRKNNRYRERITAPDGEVVRDVDEPLSEHRGHGADQLRP